MNMLCTHTFFYFQTQSLKTFVVKALTDTVLEDEEHFRVHLFPAKSDVVIDPLNGQYYFTDSVMMSNFHICLYFCSPSCSPLGMAAITIRADKGAMGIVGVAESSSSILMGEPQGDYDGSAIIRWDTHQTSLISERKFELYYVQLTMIHFVEILLHILSCLSLVRGPGVFGEIQVHWNITPAVFSEFEAISGSVTMGNRQSNATIILKVLTFKNSLKIDTVNIQ